MSFRLMPCLTALIVVVLTGCAGQEDLFRSNPFPANYKADVIAFLRTYLNDPTNIRNATSTQPVSDRIGGGPERYAMCVRFNTRPPNPQTIDLGFTFREGKLDRYFELNLQDNDADAATRRSLREVCKALPYQPFPELEHLTR